MEVHQRGLITGILMAALAISPLAEAKRAGVVKATAWHALPLQASHINNLVKWLQFNNLLQHLKDLVRGVVQWLRLV